MPTDATTPPWVDPIVVEVRLVRDAYAAAHHYNLDEIFDDLERRQAARRANGGTLVSFPPKRVLPRPSEK